LILWIIETKHVDALNVRGRTITARMGQVNETIEEWEMLAGAWKAAV
jgi:hypothetical protein